MLNSKYSDTFQVGDKVKALIPQRSGYTFWTVTGTVTGIRHMKTTGRTFYVIDGKSGIRPEWCTLVEKVPS